MVRHVFQRDQFFSYIFCSRLISKRELEGFFSSLSRRYLLSLAGDFQSMSFYLGSDGR